MELESAKGHYTLGSKGHTGSGYQNPERLAVTVEEGPPIGDVAFSQGMRPLEGRRKPNATGKQRPREPI